MFELDREVRAWTEAVYSDRCRNGESVAELRDHLYCEIDRARAEGMPDERAFATAIERLGPMSQLAAEQGKNRSWFGAACAAAARFERRDASSSNRSLFVSHAVLWASVIIATSLFTSKGPGTTASAWVILSGQVACWFASEQILRRALRARARGGER